MNKCDFLIVGSGIIGLTLSLELKSRFPSKSIIILEKETDIGFHASGRNSGVIHSGVYYKPNSIKSKVCIAGRKKLLQWSNEHKVDIKKVGKVIVASSFDETTTLQTLAGRVAGCGLDAETINNERLKKIEPCAKSSVDRSLHIPDTYVVNMGSLLYSLKSELLSKQVDIRFGSKCIVKNKGSFVTANGKNIEYGHLFNVAGAYSDEIAHQFLLAQDLIIVPFKGVYYKFDPFKTHINGLIYPVPDLAMPFLGIHFTVDTTGKAFIGPNALPSLGKENYRFFKNMSAQDMYNSYKCLSTMFLRKPGFRKYVYRETKNLIKHYFVESAKRLVPNLDAREIGGFYKSGIRAQLVNRKTHELVDDFVIMGSERETHVLNAISPAMTSSMAFAEIIADKYSTR